LGIDVVREDGDKVLKGISSHLIVEHHFIITELLNNSGKKYNEKMQERKDYETSTSQRVTGVGISSRPKNYRS